jgi:hypothetical protein
MIPVPAGGMPEAGSDPIRKDRPGYQPRVGLAKLSRSRYPVERENRVERAIRRMHKAGDKIGPHEAPRPKRMRYKTFLRLALKARQQVP